MTSFGKAALRLALAGTSALAVSIVAVAPASAQLTTSTVRGRVLTAEGAPVASAQVTATNAGTGAVRRATTDAEGGYTLIAVTPGEYLFAATATGGETVSTQARVQVGQTATLNLTLGGAAPESAVAEDGEIIVTGRVLVETKTSEIATNVTEEQIENLPQGNRNFLAFAALAPGIRVSGDEQRRTFSGGGVGNSPEPFGGPQVNVFIDGVSLKSNVQQGGIVGQDSSRGNPFSQLAVQEFRVTTQQFKAEFEDAGTAIITAITKSGTNEFHGDAFALFRPTSFTSRDPIQKRDNRDKPKQDQYQFGASLGGPIVEDKLHFFLAYELNDRSAASTVTFGGDPARRAQVPFDLDALEGSFASPFRQHTGFGKLNWQITDNQTLELTGSLRIEDETRDFGGQAAITRATDYDNDVFTGSLKHILAGDNFTNEVIIDYLQYDVGFTAVNDGEFGQIFDGVAQLGGRPDSQAIAQRGYTFRDNFTYTGIDNHTIKAGAKVSFQKYDVAGSGPARNPQFFFRIDPRRVDGQGNPQGNGLDFTTPERVEFGSGDPRIRANTTQFGFYIQDDWEVTDRLLLNLGVRWDFETNANNNNFVTSDLAAGALRALDADPRSFDFFNAEDFISTGDNRDIDYGQIAPRFGFSYDLFGDQRTVIFGGGGRYFDRTIFRAAAEETLLRQFRRSEILFRSPDGQPRLDNRPTIAFNPAFLTPGGFQQLLNTIGTPDGELRVNPNNLKAPRTDQWSIGVRQRFELASASLHAELSYANQKSRNLIGYFPANRGNTFNAQGFREFIPLINGFGNVVAASNDRAANFQAIYAKLDKTYTQSSGWGFGIAYTYVIESEERGFPFNFDHPDIASEPFLPNSGSEDHRLVVNTILDLPWGFKFSSLTTLGSGQPFFVIDASRGFGDDRIELSNVGDSDSFFTTDIRLAKEFAIFDSHEVGFTFEVFNLFDTKNFTGFDGFVPPTPEMNANFGRPNAAAPGRSFQLGVNYKF